MTKHTQYFKHLFFAITVILFLAGCSSNSDNENVPEWVLFPTQDNQQYMYGVGVGMELEEAKQHALKEIASKFSVSVNSDTLHKQSLHNGQVDQLFSQNINTQVKDIEFTHVEQKKAERVNQQYFVQVAISRAEFIKDKKSKLTTITNSIDSTLQNISSKSKIEQLYAYNKIQTNVAEAEPLLYLIAVADNGFDLTPYTRLFQQYSLAEKQLLASTHFYIQATKKLSPIADQLNDLIQTHGFQVSSKRKADAIIKLQGKVKNSQAFSAYSTRINFSFLVTSKKGTVYSKKSYLLNGSSVTNYQRAYESAVSKFLTVVEKRSDVYQLLGFDD
tara:strand:+ start:4684 stop:5676 length:993 start_codon:yes stop_codon:yes gene_type:complete